MTDLFRAIQDDIDVTLFKGAGPSSSRERVVPHVKRTGALRSVFGNRFLYRRSQLEFASFAFSLRRQIIGQGFDIVHFIDPQLVPHLTRMRRASDDRFRLLFTNGGPISFDATRYVDHVHCPTPSVYKENVRTADDSERVSMVPVGFDPAYLTTNASRSELRRRAGIGNDTFVILSVTSLNRNHKRVDYLIDEVSKLDGNLLLWVDASLHPEGDPTLLKMANEKLGKGFRHTHVSSDQVKELYHLADVMVSTSLHESFGMAVVEATFCGLPVVTHDCEHFRWLVGDRGRFVDMKMAGTLAAELTRLMRGTEELKRIANPADARQKYGMERVKLEYLDLYRKVVGSDIAAAVTRVS